MPADAKVKQCDVAKESATFSHCSTRVFDTLPVQLNSKVTSGEGLDKNLNSGVPPSG
jgi:hypothetical protein